MATLTARNLHLTRGAQPVLAGVSLTVAPGQRVGMVGPNGVGKSTLLHVLAGRLAPERGDVVLAPPLATVGHLAQEPERRTDETVRDQLARRTGVAAADRELTAATEALAAGIAGSDHRYTEALERWLALGGADLDTSVGEVWHDLGLPDGLLDQTTASLSGGQAARVQLATVLLARFDVLLLDEPTNDLDFDGLARLESFLAAVDVPVAVVSHDRAFLERVVTDVLELDEHTREGRWYSGGWLAYQDERATARRHQEEAYSEYVRQRDVLRDRARRERQWSTAGVAREKRSPRDNDKTARKFRQEQTEQLAARASRTQRAIERLEVVEKPWEGWELRFEIAAAPRAGDVVARLERAVVDRGGFRLGPVDLEVGWAERVAITGRNGAGKTTLLGALLGQLPLTGGERWIGPGVVVGELDQGRRRLEGPGSLLDAFLAATRGTVSEARSLLATFGLGANDVLRPLGELSPGERTRAALALLQANGVNCLVLDEPTNHLDLPAIEQLEQALASFPGTLLLVTHDRRLLEAVHLDRRLHVARGRVEGEGS